MKHDEEKTELRSIGVYKPLPSTPYEKRGKHSRTRSATKVVDRQYTLDKCPPRLTGKHERSCPQQNETMKSAVKEVVIGLGDNCVKIDGRLVTCLHEFTNANPTAIAIDVADEMAENEIVNRVKRITDIKFEFNGQTLGLDLIAVRSTSNDPEKFRAAVKVVVENTSLPLILCSLRPDVIEAGLTIAPTSRPLLYAATEDNWKEMAELALTYRCPLAVSARGNIRLLRSLTTTLLEHGVQDLVLDPGTFSSSGLAETLRSFTMIRTAACKGNDKLFGFPLFGVPMMAWIEKGEALDEIAMWREAYVAAMLIVRFADVLLLHSLEGWSLLPNLVLRHNIYEARENP